MFLFKKKSKSHLGIDISGSAIKIVELNREEGRYELSNYAIFSLEKYLENRNQQSDKDAPQLPNEEMAKIIKQTIKEAKIKSKDVYLSVPVYSSFYTLIDFPSMTEKEIEAAIPFEARKYVPIPISEVVLDWSIVSPPDNKDSQQVLLIAVPKKIIENYSKIVRLAGLNLKGIEGETFGLTRALVGNDKSAVILVDNGARSINVSIIDDGYIRVAHNLEMGGQKITKAIAQQMDIDLDKAERLKKDLSDKESDNFQLKRIIQSSLKMIAIEIKKIVDSYQNKYNRKIGKGILVGNGVYLSGFTDSLVEELSLDASIGNPFARVAHPDILKTILNDLGPSLSVAIGLAMRED